MQSRMILKSGKLLRDVPIAWTVAAIAIIFSLVYCLLEERAVSPASDYETFRITGKVADKRFDENGDVKSIRVNNALCYVNENKLQDVSIGDIVSINGNYVNISRQRNPAGFNALSYYLPRGIDSILYADTVYVQCKSENVILESFYRTRRWLTKRVNKYCPLMKGTILTMVVGIKESLPVELSNLFSSVGLIHILTVSGYHLTLIMTAVYGLISLTGIHKKWVSFGTMFFVIAYSILAGLSVSLIRAMIMFILKLLADIVQRSYNTFSALCISAGVTLLISPHYLMDASFLYSYVSIFSIVLFTVTFRGKRKSFKKTVLFVLFMMFMMLPLQLRFNARATLLSCLVNLSAGVLLAPFLVVCIFALLAAVLGLKFWAGAGDFLCYILCKLISAVCSVFSARRTFTLYGLPSALTTLVYYTGMVALMIFMRKRMLSKRMMVMLATSMLAILSGVKGGLSITAVDVGQGDCFVIKDAGTTGVMIDGGSLKKPSVYKDCIAPVLYSNGITTLKDVYITHPDEDHTNAIIALMEDRTYSDIKIKRILLPGSTYQNYTDVIETALSHNVQVMLIDDFGKIEYARFSMSLLFPFEEGLTGDPNSDSMNLLFSHNDFDMLFTGDSTFETEQKLLERYRNLKALTSDGQIEVLKVAHHGSKFSSSPAFLEEVGPKVAIISAGLHNPYGHPHKDTLERLASLKIKIYSTAQNGAVSIDLERMDKPSSLIFIETMIN